MERILLNVGPFSINLETPLKPVIESVKMLYAEQFFLTDSTANGFFDFHIKIDNPSQLRRWYKPQVQFYFDGKLPFKPLPFSQAYPFFEWGLNWCIATQVFNYLLIHSAVVERNGFALILSGQPGAGKSTLCAALVNRGWRLLSDEMAVVDLQTNWLIPIVRPVSLKNESIQIIKNFAPDVVLGESFYDTAKGTVSHMKPGMDSVLKAKQNSPCKWIILPRFVKGADIVLKELPKTEAVLKLAENSFNYAILSSQGFLSLCELVDASYCYELEYSNLDEAIALLADLPV
ncbi:MAG: HprK-related kinase A [Methylococcaceae bacterium]|jgi:hypothetical protein